MVRLETPLQRKGGSIVEELKEVGLNASFPSPLCGKGGEGVADHKLYSRLKAAPLFIYISIEALK